jgi:hypothetical protein
MNCGFRTGVKTWEIGTLMTNPWSKGALERI